MAHPPLVPSPPLPDVLVFMQLLWNVVHRLDQTSKRMRSQLGVTGPQRLALRVIGLYPGVSAGDLARILHVHPSTLTGVLRRLQQQKFLHRRADPRDRRRAVLDLTAAGQAANGVKTGTVEAAVAAALARCADRDVTAAAHVLATLAAQLEQGARVPVRRGRTT